MISQTALEDAEQRSQMDGTANPEHRFNVASAGN
jgi:hypothetical protein